MNILGSRIKNIFWILFGILLFIGIWYLASLRLGSSRLPSPLSVAKVLFPILFYSRAVASQVGANYNGVAPHILVSLLKLLAGSFIGILSGVLIGFIMSASKIVSSMFDVVTRMFRAIPPLALIPFILVWFGTRSEAQIVLVAAYTFIVMLATTLEAVRHVDPIYKNFAASIGASPIEIYRDVVLHAILPEIAGSVRVTLAFAWGLVIVAELLGGRLGIGRVISYMTPLYLVDQIIAVIIWIGVVGMAIDQISLRLEKSLFKWR